jgi:gamma-glutamylaminecyclotransferase
MTQYTLFVYGTLKKNFGNHHLLRTSLYLGKGRTQNKYAMYVDNIPYVVKDRPISLIYGELYQVDACQLERLDRLEGHPEWYCREQVQVVDQHKLIVTAWMYLFPDRIGRLNATGRYQRQHFYPDYQQNIFIE